MQTKTNAVLSALLRSDGFMEENAERLTGVDLTSVRTRLRDIIASFTAHAVEQNANDRDTKGESAKQQQLRVSLSADVMRPVAEIARRNLRAVPEFKSLQMPRRRLGGPSFVAGAKGMAEAATIHKDTLIERGMPADFLEHFQAGLVQLEGSVSNGEKSRTRRIGATKGLLFQEQEGRSVLKVLDALMRRALRDNAALLGAWKGARAIHRRPGGSTTPSTTQASAITPATPPVTNAAA